MLVGGSECRVEVFDTVHWGHVMLLCDRKS